METTEVCFPAGAAFGGALVAATGAVLLARRGVPVCPRWCTAAAAVTCGLCGAFGTGPPWWIAVLLCLSSLGVLLAAADLHSRRLPNVLTGAASGAFGVLLAVAPASGADVAVLARAGVGVLVFGGAHLVLHLVSPAGLGAGDVKLAVPLGAVLGVLGVTAMVLAAVLAAVVTVLLAAAARWRAAQRWWATQRWRDGVPHGPGLLLATWLLAVPAGGVAG